MRKEQTPTPADQAREQLLEQSYGIQLYKSAEYGVLDIQASVEIGVEQSTSARLNTADGILTGFPWENNQNLPPYSRIGRKKIGSKFSSRLRNIASFDDSDSDSESDTSSTSTESNSKK